MKKLELHKMCTRWGRRGKGPAVKFCMAYAADWDTYYFRFTRWVNGVLKVLTFVIEGEQAVNIAFPREYLAHRIRQHRKRLREYV